MIHYRDLESELGWVPVHKNASTTMSVLTQKNGWQREIVDNPNVELFGIIQNPWNRFLKGIAEVAWVNNERSFDVVRKQAFFKMAFLDHHMMPINLQLLDSYKEITWLPMDVEDRSINDILNEFLENRGSRTRIEAVDIKHKSNTKKQKYQAEVKDWIQKHYPYKKQVLKLLEPDFELWRESLIPYQPAVQEPSWLERFLNRIMG